MSKPKILILVDWFVPAYKAGGPVKSIRNLVDLQKDRFDFYILTGDRDLGENQPYEDIEFNTWQSKDGYHVCYLSSEEQRLLKLYEVSDEVNPDVTYVNGIFSTFFSIYPVFLKVFGKIDFGKMIIAPRGMLGEGARQKKALKKRVFLKFYRWLVGRASNIRWHTTYARETNDVMNLLNVDRKSIFEIGNIPDLPVDNIEADNKEDELRLVLISRLDREKNIDGLLLGLGALDSKIRLDLFGRFGSEAFRMKIEGLMGAMPSNVKCEYKGLLHPTEVQSMIQQYDGFITLTHGENFGHSIFEALGAARPVIISAHTPWSKIEEEGGGFVVNNQEELKSAIAELQDMDFKKWRMMCMNSLGFAEKYIEDSRFKENYEKMLTP